MINIDFTNIDNSKMIARVLPFWARGRKLSLLLQALLNPIVSAHRSFQDWGLQRYIECRVTGQKKSIEWYLKYKLQFHFLNEGDTFFVSQDVKEIMEYLETDREDNSELQGQLEEWIADQERNGNDLTQFNQTIVFAPAIMDTVSYDHSDYERDIRNIMSKYMINFNKISIIIANN